MSTTDPRRETNGRTVAAAPHPEVEPGPGSGVTQASLPGFRQAARGGPRRPANPRALLLGSPRTVLARLTCGDPLDLAPLVARRLRTRHLLMDARRVKLGALVRCAREGSRYRGQQTFERWLEERVDRAIEELLDAPALADGDSATPSESWEDLARPLGLSAERMVRASRAFNALPPEPRAAFFHLVLGGRSLDGWSASTGRGAARLARDARRALQVFLDAAAPMTPERRS